jgi:integrase/recombinase XerC
MVSNSCPEDRQTSGDNVFGSIPVGREEPSFLHHFLDSHDFSANSRRAFVQDVRKFAKWFSSANSEPFRVERVTCRDVSDFRDDLRRNQGPAVASVNRALVTLRRFFTWLVEQGHVPSNPAKAVKELRRVQLAPKGLDKGQVRRLLREVELRQDIRAAAIFSILLYTGCRVSDVINLELTDVVLNERSGSAVFRFGKGNKQRSVPLSTSCQASAPGLPRIPPTCGRQQSLHR